MKILSFGLNKLINISNIKDFSFMSVDIRLKVYNMWRQYLFGYKKFLKPLQIQKLSF